MAALFIKGTRGFFQRFYSPKGKSQKSLTPHFPTFVFLIPGLSLGGVNAPLQSRKTLSVLFQSIPLRESGVHSICIIYKTPPCLPGKRGEDITGGLKGYTTLPLSVPMKEAKRP